MTGDTKGPVWVIAQQINDQVPNVCLELIGKAHKLADDLGVSTDVVFLGNGIRDHVEKLFYAGADVIYLGDNPKFELYHPEIFTESVVSLSEELRPQIILIGSTFMGRELAPLIAARLGTGLTAHCIDLDLDENGILEQQIPAYGGLMSIICPEKRPQISTIAPGVFPLPVMDDKRSGQIIPIPPPRGLKTRLQTLEVVNIEQERVPLESAQVVVAGGVGAGSIEGWKEIEALAEILKAGLGSTRPVVDEGWIELETMIGQSGKMVNPELYIGVGLSGEQQHMVGISGAKIMIAINSDPKAPVFDQVDYGVVEDCRIFLPALVESIKKLKEHIGRTANVV